MKSSSKPDESQTPSRPLYPYEIKEKQLKERRELLGLDPALKSALADVDSFDDLKNLQVEFDSIESTDLFKDTLNEIALNTIRKFFIDHSETFHVDKKEREQQYREIEEGSGEPDVEGARAAMHSKLISISGIGQTETPHLKTMVEKVQSSGELDYPMGTGEGFDYSYIIKMLEHFNMTALQEQFEDVVREADFYGVGAIPDQFKVKESLIDER